MSHVKKASVCVLGFAVLLGLGLLLVQAPAALLAAQAPAGDAAVAPALAALSGHVYDGDYVGDPNKKPLGGVTVTLYGAKDGNQV